MSTGLTLEASDLTISWLFRCNDGDELKAALAALERSAVAYPILEGKVREKLASIAAASPTPEKLRVWLSEAERRATENPETVLREMRAIERVFEIGAFARDNALAVVWHATLSFCLCALGRDAAAVASASAGIAAAERMPSAPRGSALALAFTALLAQRALCRERLGDAAAANDYARLLAIEPTNELARAAIPRAAFAVSDAVRLFAVEAKPRIGDARALLSKAAKSYCEGEYVAAMRLYGEALAVLARIGGEGATQLRGTALSNRALSAFRANAFEVGYRDATSACEIAETPTRIYRKLINLSKIATKSEQFAEIAQIAERLLAIDETNETVARIAAAPSADSLAALGAELRACDGAAAAWKSVSARAADVYTRDFAGAQIELATLEAIVRALEYGAANANGGDFALAALESIARTRNAAAVFDLLGDCARVSLINLTANIR